MSANLDDKVVHGADRNAVDRDHDVGAGPDRLAEVVDHGDLQRAEPAGQPHVEPDVPWKSTFVASLSFIQFTELSA